jgi:hypothetical protein
VFQTTIQSGFARSRSEALFPRLFPDAGWWCPSLQSPGGTRLHDLRGGNWGTLTNMTPASDWAVDGGKGALDFDGSNDHVLIPRSGVGLTQFSLFFWARPLGSVATQQGIFQWANSLTSPAPFVLITRQSGSVTRFYANGGYRQTVTTPSDWAQYGFAYSAGVWRFFLNGLQVGSHTGGLAGQATAANLYLGNGFAAYFQGQIDDARLYSIGLDALDCMQLYRLGRGNMPMVRKRRYAEQEAAAGFKAYWARRQSQLIGGGV